MSLKCIFRGGCITTAVFEKDIFKDGCIAAAAPDNAFSGAVHVFGPPLKKHF
jgi:hypothetical protein